METLKTEIARVTMKKLSSFCDDERITALNLDFKFIDIWGTYISLRIERSTKNRGISNTYFFLLKSGENESNFVYYKSLDRELCLLCDEVCDKIDQIVANVKTDYVKYKNISLEDAMFELKMAVFYESELY